MPSKYKVLLVGSGALGVVAAYTLEYNGFAEVTVVVRSGYKKASTEGYKIDSIQFGKIESWKPSRVVPNVEEAIANGEVYDYIFTSVKNLPDSPTPCEQILEPVLKANTKATVILCQNGLDIEKPFLEKFPGHVILSCVSLIGCTNIDCVVNQMTPDNVQIGVFENPTIKDKEEAERKLDEFISIYKMENGKNVVKKDVNPRLTRWQKLVYNAAINTSTALTDLDCSRAAMAGCKESIWRPIMREIYAIAKSDGYILPPDLEENMLRISDGLFYTPSMLVDVRLNRMVEVEVIVGNPLRIAQRNGVDAPHLSMTYHLLKMVQFRIMEKQKIITVDDSVREFKNPDAQDNVL
ncbi:hypothetical protein OGAPHI_000626 [Ogataea philodendri]|uniref:2-dehydropantoate 2-reductase n=1 Tax=Ogataea philodendri TaxID=1378263 RepID=A0A9P8PG40_9ASCO|nr:uncharacterized protein OGAPHI_000626 [Ogataea philodendri]KAH3670915.1 hypothetical protein OGAPHI_000626 [Ogataea philodendri]